MNLTEFIEGRRDQHLAELCEFLRIPSVSAKSEHKPDIERAARWVASKLQTAGFKTVEVIPTSLHPLVYAESLEAPGKPTILFYGHYDVQPAEPLDLWTTPAFEPTVRDGKLLTMEGDYDHIVNRGSLCVKGISMFATHTSPNRLQTPRYRAPGSDHWEDISWDDAIMRVAQKIRKTRDATWIATEKVGDKEVPVNRTDAIGFLGGAQNTNEECYLFQKAARLLGLAYVEHQARL